MIGRQLFLEKIVESAARIRGTNRRSLTVSAARIARFAFDRRACHEEVAFVAQILLRDSFRNRLRAFELCRSIKMPAVFASVQVCLTFRALAFVLDVNRRGNDCAAKSAPEHFLEAGHLHCPRGFSGLGPTWSTLRFFARLFAFSFATFAVIILITALAVFSFHRKVFREKSPVFQLQVRRSG
jgi:hypothetical protein